MNPLTARLFSRPVRPTLWPVPAVRFSGGEDPDPFTVLGLKEKGYANPHSLVKRALSPKNYLGEGYYKKVFNVPGTDYVLAIPIPFYVQLKPDAFPGINVGQPVASLGDMQLLKKQHGKPHGALHWRNPPIDEAENRLRHQKFLKQVSQMPQKAYDQLVKNLIAINQAGFKWDGANANNLLVDTPHKALNLVDLDRKESNEDPAENNNLTSLLIGLLDSYFAYPREKARPEPGLIMLRRTVFEKALKATIQEGLPLSHQDNYAWRKNDPTFTLKAVLGLCGEDLSDQQINLFLNHLKQASPPRGSSPQAAQKPLFQNVWTLLQHIKQATPTV